MPKYLKQSTSATLLLGPFVSSTDGTTITSTLSITPSLVRLSKNGDTPAAKNDGSSSTYKEFGFYQIPINTTDTDTINRLKVSISVSGTLSVWDDFVVLGGNVYDWFMGAVAPLTSSPAVATAVDTQLTANHGAGIWASGTATVVDNAAIATAVDTKLAANHGLGIWTSGTATVVDNAAIATAVDTQLASTHGIGIWTSGTATVVDNAAIATAVDTQLTANHGLGIWTSGTATAIVDNAAIAVAVNSNLTANHGLGIWTSGLAAQDVANAMKLAPAAGTPAAGSMQSAANDFVTLETDV